ncbi:GTPase Era [Gracilariopsis chorda]|uniref:GTPase Era n=1 Tax=Gracilariopsis chorda TaxID=448386 RepID=A0A2V3IL57_9FLOR|nr:GTPase Era [Gracilariopsis chorda]|eukprot:PXF42779.1 GTPase Era [Gracilariopsis chorda]
MFRTYFLAASNSIPSIPRLSFARRFCSSSKESAVDYSAALPHIPADTRIASVALIGAPNAGKSSLSNALIGSRVSAVSRKVNATRSRTIGAYTSGNRQLIFWDTPGVVERQFLKTLRAERRELTTDGWGAAVDADVVVLVVDASRGEGYWRRCANISEQIAESRGKARQQSGLLLVLNKCDKVTPRSRILTAADFFQTKVSDFKAVFEDRIFMVSAYNGRGVNDLRDKLLDMTTEGDFEVPPDTAYCDDELDVVRQHIWEKLLHRVHEEVPYQCRFENEKMMQLPNGDLYISEVIRVPRSSAVGIVVGPGGQVIEWIRDTAAQSSSEVLKRAVHLKLRVAVA